MAAQSQPVIALAEGRIEFFADEETTVKIAQPGKLVSSIYPIVTIHNAGGGNAKLTAASADWFIGGELPAIPIRGGYMGVNIILKPNTTHRLRLSRAPSYLSEKEFSRSGKGEPHLWFYGSIRYSDVLNNIFEQGLVAHWEEMPTCGRMTGRGIIVEGPVAYNSLIQIDGDQRSEN